MPERSLLAGTEGSWIAEPGRPIAAQIRNNDPPSGGGERGRDAILAEDRSVASGRTMASIAAGKGRAPKPFMAAGTKPAKPNAVWDTSQGLAADQRRRRKAG